MRIAVGGWLHETNTFSTMPTRYEDFYFTRGQAVVDKDAWKPIAREGHDLIPLPRAWGHPSGRVTLDCFRRITDEIVSGLQANLPLDAVFLDLHGAMEVEEIGDGEAELLREVRGVVGPEVLIGGTLDLHGNLSHEFVGQCDFLTALRTAPHRDGAETLERGVKLLMKCLKEKIRPTTELIKLPFLLPGEAGVTEVEPTRSCFARLPAIDARPGIFVSSIMVGCAWTDCPDTSVSVLVCGTDRQAMRAEGMELAKEIWAHRAEFQIDVPTADTDDAIRMAADAPERPVFISDSGDNTTAGGAGDSPFFLERLIALEAKEAVMAGICDPEAVAQCFEAGVGNEVDLVIGGRLDQQFAKPFATRARVKRLVSETEGVPPRALVDIGGIETVLQSDRGPFTRLCDFERMGIKPEEKKILVVKLGYLFPELRDYAPKAIMAFSPGFGDQRMDRLPFERLRRPIFPLDPETEWEPGQ